MISTQRDQMFIQTAKFSNQQSSHITTQYPSIMGGKDEKQMFELEQRGESTHNNLNKQSHGRDGSGQDQSDSNCHIKSSLIEYIKEESSKTNIKFLYESSIDSNKDEEENIDKVSNSPRRQLGQSKPKIQLDLRASAEKGLGYFSLTQHTTEQLSRSDQSQLNQFKN